MQIISATEIGRVSTNDTGDPCETVKRSRSPFSAIGPKIIPNKIPAGTKLSLVR